jgi:mannose/fructose/N-acetylgalactosamine-specific phosphotransferase system component IIC
MLVLLLWWMIPVSSVILFVFLGFGEDALKKYRMVGKAIIGIIPSRFLPKRSKKFGKGMFLASPLPSSVQRFVF